MYNRVKLRGPGRKCVWGGFSVSRIKASNAITGTFPPNNLVIRGGEVLSERVHVSRGGSVHTLGPYVLLAAKYFALKLAGGGGDLIPFCRDAILEAGDWSGRDKSATVWVHPAAGRGG